MQYDSIDKHQEQQGEQIIPDGNQYEPQSSQNSHLHQESQSEEFKLKKENFSSQIKPKEDQQFQSQESSDKSRTSYLEKQYQPRKWQWAYPVVQGVNPCPRGGHTATLSGHSIIIFGGHYYTSKQIGYTYLNDTYLLDVNGNRFMKAKSNGTVPSPRYGHTAVLIGSRIVIFGGKGQKGKILRDLHALDPGTMTWFQSAEGIGSPSARFGHTANLVSSNKMLIFGGWNGKNFFNDLYVLDLELIAWSQPKCSGTPPSPRQGHVAVQIGGNLIVQGGFCFNEEKQREAGFRQGSCLRECYLNDLQILDTDSYSWVGLRVSGTPPLPRYGHTANMSSSDIIFFGGWSVNSGARNEKIYGSSDSLDYFMVMNTENELVWQRGKFEGQPPVCRYGHTSTSVGPHLLIFGGWEQNRASNEVVVLRDLSAKKQQNINFHQNASERQKQVITEKQILSGSFNFSAI